MAVERSRLGYGVSVTAVSHLEGSASIVVSRGTTKHLFELACHVEWEATANGADGADAEGKGGATLAKGVLEYSDIAPSASGVGWELNERPTKRPRADAAADVERHAGELKKAAATAMREWLAEFRQRQ